VLASDRSYVTSSAKLEEWASIVGRIIDAKRRPPEPDPPPVPPPPPPEPEAEPYVAPEPEPIVAAAPLASEAPRFEEAAADQPQLEALSAPAVEEWAPQAAAVAPVDLAERRTDPADVRAGGSRMPLMIMAGVIALLIVIVIWMSGRNPGAPKAGEGELVVQSRPAGASVSVDGTKRGVTPLTVSLKSGAHVLEVQIGKSEPRVIPLTIQANVQTAQYIELQGVQATGSLAIKSEPSGARVSIDGQPRGTTPATIRELPAGDHSVVLELGNRKATQAVKIEAGSTAQLVVPIPRR
jgi:hypothetical protein